MDLHKIGIKWTSTEHEAVNLLDLIPVFHRWIQQHLLEDLLIDVAEYTHVHHGPGVLLIAHQGNYGYDETGGERGLLYYSKRSLDGELPDRLVTVARKGLAACRLLEQDDTLGGRLAFPGHRIEFFANDRLVAPNTDETWARLEPALRGLLDRLYPDGGYALARIDEDPRDRLAARAEIADRPGSAVLLARLS